MSQNVFPCLSQILVFVNFSIEFIKTLKLCILFYLLVYYVLSYKIVD